MDKTHIQTKMNDIKIQFHCNPNRSSRVQSRTSGKNTVCKQAATGNSDDYKLKKHVFAQRMGSEDNPATANVFYKNNASMGGEEDTEAIQLKNAKVNIKKDRAKLSSVASEKEIKHNLGIETQNSSDQKR